MRIFVAGATGVIGRVVVALLVRSEHEVTGMTRSAGGAAELRRQGAQAVVVDAFAPALEAAVVSSAPRAIVHQLTALPDTLEGLSPDALTAALRANARMRTEGTRNLTAAATRAGATRLVAQSIAWSYAPGPEPHTEDAPLDVTADGNRRVTIDGVVALERAVLQAPGIEGVVLRYGFLYGHRPGVDRPQRIPSVHVEAAAWAATLAIDHGGPGVYNIVDDDPTVSNTKARRQLGWDPRFRTEPARGERQAAQSRS